MDRIKQLMSKNAEFDFHDFEERLAHYNIPGCAFTIIDNHKILKTVTIGAKAYGTADKVNEETLFQAASISKFMFASLVMRLKELRHLSLDADIHTYLKNYALTDRFRKEASATLRQLLSHTSGTTVHGFGGYAEHDRLIDVVDVLEGNARVNSKRVYKVRKDEGRFKYSGGGTTIAQKCISDLMGKPLEMLMETYVFGQLMMGHSTVEQPLPKHYTNFAKGHIKAYETIPNGFHYYPEQAAAGVWTTSHDLAVFGKALINAYHGRDDFLAPSSIRTMATPMSEKGILSHMPEVKAGVGCFIKETDGRLIIGHSGSNEGFVSHCGFSLKSGKGFSIMLNANRGGLFLTEFEKAVERIFDW